MLDDVNNSMVVTTNSDEMLTAADPNLANLLNLPNPNFQTDLANHSLYILFR